MVDKGIRVNRSKNLIFQADFHQPVWLTKKPRKESSLVTTIRQNIP